MKTAFSLWRPASKSPKDLIDLTAEIIKTLAPYGYGALPSSDLHAKLRVDGFVEVLEEFPIWAVAKAGLNWRKTQTQAPTPKDWSEKTKIEMGYYEPILVLGNKMMLGSVHEKLLKWATGKSVWADIPEVDKHLQNAAQSV